MRTFKLKQKYPSLPNDWQVGMEVRLGDRNYSYSPCNGNYRDVKLDNKEVENNYLFWEEVVDKNYEILTVTPSKNNSVYADKTTNIEFRISNKDFIYWDIFAVKNLKTEETIKIGDNVCFEYSGVIITVETLDEWDNRIIINKAHPINCVKLTKVSLFATNDGVEIFEGDSFYYVGDAFNICLTKSLFKGDGDFTKFNTFSTKIGAKKFIKENEKKYSLNDIKETIKKLDCFGSTLIEYLEKN